MGNAEQILQAVVVAAELTGTQLSDAAQAVMVKKLLAYDADKVLAALDRCCCELTGRLTLAAVLERIDTGWPSADEAFNAVVEGWRNEALTVVLPRMAQEVAGDARALFVAGDKTGARMAFKAGYERRCAEAKSRGEVPDWVVEAGTDKAHLAATVMAAVKAGRLPQQTALAYLPAAAGDERHLLLTGRMLTDEQRRLGKQNTDRLLALIGSKVVAGV